VKVLIDTHVWLWMCDGFERIGVRAREVLADPETEILISSASVWEIAIKYRLGKLRLPEPPDRWAPTRRSAVGGTALPVTHAHAAAVADLPDHHQDPFDRLLIAQALLERTPIVTADGVFASYGVEVTWG